MRKRQLLATDLDGTFIGDDTAMAALWEDLEHAGVVVAFSTGRHLPSIEQFYRETGTPHRADACICMVGTEIWHRSSDGYEKDRGWAEVIADGWDKQGVEAILGAIPEAVMQPEEWQSPFKSSYFLEANAPERVAHLREDLDRAGLNAKVVYSAGRFLDLLPHRSGKGGAVAYLAEQLGVAPDDVVTAGDTGNDLDMMRPELGFRAIAVGNAAEELRAFDTAGLYHAQAPYAAGIREGLVHHGFLEV